MKNVIILLFFIFALPSVSSAKEKFIDPRERVVIVDTGVLHTPIMERVLCKQVGLHRDFTKTGLSDNIGHGTHIAHLIAKKIDTSKFCIVIVKAFSKKKYSNSVYASAIAYASKINPVVLNLSLGGNKVDKSEQQAIIRVLSIGGSVFIAGGNEEKDLNQKCSFFPGCLDLSHRNLYVVANGKRDGYGNITYIHSNRNGKIKYLENGEEALSFVGYRKAKRLTGTSQSSAILANKYIREVLTPKMNFQEMSLVSPQNLQYTYDHSPSLQSIFHWPKRNLLLELVR